MSAATSPDLLGQRGLGHVQILEQHGERAGLLDRAQVLANEVLDQRQLQRSRLVQGVVDQRRDRRLAGELGGAPAPFAGHQRIPIAERTDDDRLQHPALADRVRQRRERRLVKPPPRLVGVGVDDVDRDHPQPSRHRAVVVFAGRCDRPLGGGEGVIDP